MEDIMYKASRFYARYNLSLAIVGLIVNAFLVYIIVGIAAKQEKLQMTISTFRSSLPDDTQAKSIYKAGYDQGLKRMQEEIELSYEQGYHKATEDLQCPATGDILPLEEKSIKK